MPLSWDYPHQMHYQLSVLQKVTIKYGHRVTKQRSISFQKPMFPFSRLFQNNFYLYISCVMKPICGFKFQISSAWMTAMMLFSKCFIQKLFKACERCLLACNKYFHFTELSTERKISAKITLAPLQKLLLQSAQLSWVRFIVWLCIIHKVYK